MCSTVFRLGLQDFFLKAAAFNRIFYHQNIQNVSLLKINSWPSIASTRRRVGAAIEEWPVQGEIMEWATPVALTTEHSEFCSSACMRYQQCFAREETTFESLQYLEISPWNINKELLIQYLWCWWETESVWVDEITNCSEGQNCSTPLEINLQQEESCSCLQPFSKETLPVWSSCCFALP